MANVNTRVFTIHRTAKYNKSFVQLDYENVGVVFGKLTKVGAKNLYIYLMSNKDNYQLTMFAADYANWLGKSYSKDGKVINESLRSAIGKQLNEGIKQLIEEGYLVEVVPNTLYEFYEYGVEEQTGKKVPDEKKIPESEEKSQVEQKVPDIVNNNIFNF